MTNRTCSFVYEIVKTRRYHHSGYGVAVVESKRGREGSTEVVVVRLGSGLAEDETIAAGPWARIFDLASLLVRMIVAEEDLGPESEKGYSSEAAAWRARRVLDRVRLLVPGVLPTDDELAVLLRRELECDR